MNSIKITLSLIIVFFVLFDNNYCLSCPRTPSHLPHGRRTRGDNGYKLIIGDKPTGYVPGKTYNLLLLGSRTHSKLQQFTHFTLTAEAVSNGTKRSTPASPKRAGRFQLYSDSLTKFNDNCINTVKEADDLPKTEIQVMWVAPQTGSGCVALSAMVYEGPRLWVADDGELTKIICEKKIDADSVQEECCACDEAKYNFVFQGIWSNETHPKDFPFTVWLTHFSDVIGASHDTNFSFWGENHISTDGFRSLAEWGSPSALEAELRVKGPRLRTLIKAAGLWYPNVNLNTSSHFRVDRKHHKVSMVSMFGPSPDWVVGVNGLNLCTEDCSWRDSLDIDLYPWDAGTDSGISYMSPKAETIPRERMYRITTMYPEDPRAPFYNPNSDMMTPLAKLFIRREKIIPRNCDEDFLQALQLDNSENNNELDVKSECEVTDYTAWSHCSVTCGKGLRMRSREYKRPDLAKANNCNRQLISKEMCIATIPECGEQDEDDDEVENLAKSQTLVDDQGEGVGVCRTSAWSDWSPCSATCGVGITMRTRFFINHLGRKKCPHVSIVEKQKCMKPECTFEQEEMPDPMCPVTQWSDWSPCTATCGRGVTVRSRLLLVGPELQKNCSERRELDQQKECTIRQDCTIDSITAREICQEKPESGQCRASYRRYAYNPETGTCHPFIFGGCRGNRNNFFTIEECMRTCQVMKNEPEMYTTLRPSIDLVSGYDNKPKSYTNDQQPQNCVLSDWGEWSSCSATCGAGYQERYRTVIREPRNGGIQCPKRTLKRRRCTMPECPSHN